MKKLILLTLVIFGLIFAFWEDLLIASLQHYFKKIVQNELPTSKISVNSVKHLGSGTFSIKQLEIIDNENSVYIPTATINITVDLHKIELSLKLELDSLNINYHEKEVCKIEAAARALYQRSLNNKNYFPKINYCGAINSGAINIFNDEGSIICFPYGGYLQNTPELSCKIWASPSNISENEIVLTINKSENKTIYSLSLLDCDLKNITTLMNKCTKTKTKKVQGITSGALNLTADNSFLEASGELYLNGIKIPSLSINKTLENDSTYINIFPSKISSHCNSIKELLIQLNLEITSTNTVVNDKNNLDTHLQIPKASFKNKHHQYTLSAEGCLQQIESFPFQIKSICDKKLSMQIICDNSQATMIYNDNTLSIDTKNFDLKTAAAFHNFLEIANEKIVADSGNANISMEIDNNISPPRIYLKELYIKKIKGHFLGNDISCSEISGKMQYLVDNKFSLAIMLSDANANLSSLPFPLNFEGFHGTLVISDGLLDVIDVKGSVNDLKCHINNNDDSSLLKIYSEGSVCDYIDICATEPLKTNLMRHWKDDTFKLSSTIDLLNKKETSIESLLELGDSIFKINNKFVLGKPLTGSIEAVNLPLNKFLEPFLRHNTDLQIHGSATATGTITGGKIELTYDAKDINISSSIFEIVVPRIENGEHSFNISDKKHRGSASVEEGSYLDKKHNVTFDKITSSVYFNNKTISIEDIITHCNDIESKGNLSVDFREHNKNIVDININDISGEINDLQHICNKFLPNALWETAITGNKISLHNKNNMRITTIKDSQTILFEANLQGTCKECDITLKDTTLRNSNFSFKLDNQKKILKIYNLSADIKHREEEIYYSLTSPYIQLLYKDNPEYSFEISMKNCPFSSFLKGSAKINESKEYIDWEIDNKQSYIGYTKLNIQKLQTDVNLNLCELKSYPEINLKTFPEELKTIVNTIIKKDYSKLDRFFSKTITGSLNGKLEYKENVFYFDFMAENSYFDACKVKSAAISGKYHDNMLEINSYNDIFSVQSTLELNANKIHISDCDIKYDDKLNLILNGDYDFNDNKLYANIEEGLIYTPSSITDNPIRIYGPTTISKNNSTIEMSSKISIDIEDIEDVEGVKLEMSSAAYNTKLHQLENVYLDFNVPVTEIDNLHKKLKLLSNYEFLSNHSKIKNDDIKGTIEILKNSNINHWKINLEPGQYNFANIQHNLKDLCIEKIGSDISITTLYDHNNKPFWLHGLFNENSLNTTISISYDHPSAFNVSEKLPLTFFLKIDHSKENISIEKIEGTFAGINAYASPVRNASEKHHFLYSKINFTPVEFGGLLPQNLNSFITNLNLIDSFEIVGKWSIPKNNWRETSFAGTVRGNEFSAGSYIIEKLSSQISYTDGSLAFKNLACEDLGGKVNIPEISIQKDVLWKINIPSIICSNIQPSALYHIKNGRSPSNKGLNIKSMYISNFSGDLCHPSSWTGNGELLFENIKKNSHRTLFTIPSDIISRIGLDIKIFSPVTGKIEYDIRDHKVILTKIQNTYSDNHLSKFYLSKKQNNSYIDFNGNINIQIKMKQHNLIFKLAELFTITIKGDIKKPRYTLQKQNIIHQEQYESELTTAN